MRSDGGVNLSNDGDVSVFCGGVGVVAFGRRGLAEGLARGVGGVLEKRLGWLVLAFVREAALSLRYQWSASQGIDESGLQVRRRGKRGWMKMVLVWWVVIWRGGSFEGLERVCSGVDWSGGVLQGDRQVRRG